MQVWSLSQEDPLEQDMATHSSVNPMDRRVWWATIYEVSKSWTRLK